MTDEDVFLALQKKKVETEIKQPRKKKDLALKMGDVEQRQMISSRAKIVHNLQLS